MVFDKQGRFVNDLRPQDFELRIDGKLQPISFFELVSTGSANEESQLAAARGVRPGKAERDPVSAEFDRRRVIFFMWMTCIWPQTISLRLGSYWLITSRRICGRTMRPVLRRRVVR